MPQFLLDIGAGLHWAGLLACLLLGLAVAAFLAGRIRRARSRRSAAEQELRESESRYRAIFETAVDAIIVTDRHGMIQEFSTAAERMTGYLAAEVAGRNMRVLLPANLRQEHDRYTARYLWTVRELEVCRKDGTLFPAHLSIAEWWSGGHRHFTGILRDLTTQKREQIERNKLEAQLHQAQKMEAIGNLTGGMAHDFNNVLGVIIGNIDLLRDLRTDDADVDELTREALDAAFRGADLTRRLLAFARQQPLRPQRIDLNELVSGITSAVATDARRRHRDLARPLAAGVADRRRSGAARGEPHQSRQ
jgi:PAS domain S-box-containing protein